MNFEKPPGTSPEKIVESEAEQLTRRRIEAIETYKELKELKSMNPLTYSKNKELIKQKEEQEKQKAEEAKLARKEGRSKNVIEAAGGRRIENFIWDLIVEANTQHTPITGRFNSFEFTVDDTKETKKTLKETFDEVMELYTKRS